MQNERAFIEAITDGDDAKLAELLRTADDDDQIFEPITDPRPSNHAIGFGMTLLQLASIRKRKQKRKEKGKEDGKQNLSNASAMLIEHGFKVDLHSACGLGMIDRMEELLADRPDRVNDEVDSYLPIQFAITAGHPNVIECLTKHGADANRDLRKVAYFGWEDDAIDQNYTPWKPIHMASLWGFDAARVPVAEALASAGADLNAVSPLDGYRPIHLVAMANRVDMIKFFVGRGVDVDSRTKACDMINLPDEDGPVRGYDCTALMVAAGEGFAEATACLLELGADPHAVNDQGQTAIDFANKRFWNGQPYDQVIEALTKR